MEFPSEPRVRNQHLRNYFFKPGNTYSKGRPPNTKKEMDKIRGRILRVLKRRIFHETDLESVTTTDLLKFFASIAPKENLTHQATQVTYISNVPREDEPLKVEAASTEIVQENPQPLEELKDGPASPQL